MSEVISESVARETPSENVLGNRIHTLEEFYTEKYNLLKGISETHPECFKMPFKLVSFAEARDSIQVAKGKINVFIDKLSEFYVKLMNQYEYILKILIPNDFKN